MHAINQFLPEEGDKNAAKAILKQLRQMGKAKTKKNVISLELNGKHVAINDNILGIFVAVLEKVSQGEEISVVTSSQEYSAREAAEILHVSRPYLASLLDKGVIPFRRVGSHRRIEAKDLFAYKAKLEEQKRAAFEELSRLGQEIENG